MTDDISFVTDREPMAGGDFMLAIDPGTTYSAFVWLESSSYKICRFGKVQNHKVFEEFKRGGLRFSVAIEMMASYGMPVGKEVFETAMWVGRFFQAAMWASERTPVLIYRKTDVCSNLCKSLKAKDSNIRQALLDRFGEVGVKKNPGWFYGVKADVWSAIAIAVTALDKQKGQL